MASSRFSTALALSLTVAFLVGLRFDVVARGGGRSSGDTRRCRLWGQVSQPSGQQWQFDQGRAVPSRPPGQEQVGPECGLRVKAYPREAARTRCQGYVGRGKPETRRGANSQRRTR